MADAQLSVELTARIDGLRDSFNKAIRETNNLDAQTKAKLQSIDKGFADLANGIDRNFSNKVVRSVKTGSNSVSQDLAKIAKASAVSGQGIQAGSNKAGQALTDLSRITQDLPYGFIGIQNNLNPMLESFSRLRAETGSTGGALKALGSSLVGPAGLGIALAAVSTGILLYQQYQQKANRETKEAKKDTDNYVDSLDQLDQVQVRGAQNALKEQTELDTLYKITQNVTLSNKQRTEAVNELQDKYPAYFKNLDDEIIKNGGAKDAYDRLSLSILATARARAAQDLITKNSARQLENESKEKAIQAKIDKERIQVSLALSKAQTQARSGMAAGSAGVGAAQGQGIASIREKSEERINALITEQNKYRTDTSILNQKNLDLETAITDQIKQGADLTGKVGAVDTPKRAKDIRTVSDVLKELNIDLKQAENQFEQTFGGEIEDKVKAYQKAIDELIKLGLDPASDAVNRLKKAQNGLFDGALKDVPALNTNNISSGIEPIEIEPVLKLKPAFLGKDELTKIVDEAEFEIDRLTSLPELLGVASVAINNGFVGIGEAIASGGSIIEAAGSAIQQSFAQLLSALGKQFITMGTAKIAAGILASPFGGKLIADGAGLVALGAGLSVGSGIVGGAGKGRGARGGIQAQQPTAFANGGVIYGPTLGLMGEYAGAKNDPEVVAPLSKLKQILGDVAAEGGFDRSGTNSTSVNNYNSSVNNYGGSNNNSNSNNYGGGSDGGSASQPIVFSPQFVVEGELKLRGGDLVAAYRIAEAKDKRKS